MLKFCLHTIIIAHLLFAPAFAGEGLMLSDAKARVERCLSDPGAEGRPPFAIAIYDARARLQYFVAEEGVMAGAIELAQMKAETSSLFPFHTEEIGKIADSEEGAAGLAQLSTITTVAGGAPIFNDNGEHVGAVGVSGGMPTEDKACALMVSSSGR